MCPACDGKDLESTFHDVIRCKRCGLGFLTPSLRETHSRQVQDVYLTTGGRAPENPGERDHKGRVALHILNHIRTVLHKDPKRAYEIGAGSGYMVNALRGAGLTVTGNDVYLPPDQPATCWDREPFHQKWFSDAFVGAFDLVYAWDAMEHLPEIDQAFINIERILKPGGVFVMHSPFFDRYKDNKSHPYWEPGHLWHMTPFSAELLLGPGEFTVTHECGMVGGDPGLAAADNLVLWGVKK